MELQRHASCRSRAVCRAARHMNRVLLFGVGVGLCIGASVARGQDSSLAPAASQLPATGYLQPANDSTTRRKRPHAIEYSDAYATRLEIHKLGSYVMLPLFGTEYYLGERLIQGKASSGERSLHAGVALGIGALFTINTVTGAWNLWDSRKDPAGRTKRIVHSVLMTAADAGFALAAASAGDDDEGGERGESGDDANTHKAIALTSIGISTVGTILMWFFK